MVILAHPIGGPVTSESPRKNFLAPEVLERGDSRIDTKSDIWMLGCTVSASFEFVDSVNKLSSSPDVSFVDRDATFL